MNQDALDHKLGAEALKWQHAQIEPLLAEAEEAWLKWDNIDPALFTPAVDVFEIMRRAFIAGYLSAKEQS